MSEWSMQGHFRYLRFKTFPMTSRTHQCEEFWALLSSSEHSGVPADSKPPTFPSVGLHPHTWPKWGCDIPSLDYVVWCFVGLAYQAKDIVFKFIIDYSNLMDLGP
jgi:hypothetical protein